MPAPSRDEKTTALIAGLHDADRSAREASGAELFGRGRELARAAVDSWLADSEFADNLVIDPASQFPETTVGIAVAPDTFDRIRAANGTPPLADVPPDQDAREFELHFPQGVRLDILTTRDPSASGAIARYLQKLGEGIQQVELLARNVDRATEILRARFAVQPIYTATRPGADGTRVNFFLAAAPEGSKVLIELVEANPANSY